MIVGLPSNRPPERFYRGGARITALRGDPPAAEREPEDWVGSTTTMFGERELGLSRLPDGRLLREAVESDPIGWLGTEHVARWGADVRLLVKLLDAGERLPVHAHPDDAFAALHLGAAHGKAEAWYILEGGTVHLALRDDIEMPELAGLVARQETVALLGLLHEIEVRPGDVVWVPPGEPHAIGEGVLLLELQQPQDLSILLEWEGFAIDGAVSGHLGLGFELALGAVNRAGRTSEGVSALIRRGEGAGAVLPDAAGEYFRLERVVVASEVALEPGFAVTLVADGNLVIGGRPAPRGSTFVVAAEDGAVAVAGAGTLLVARPPLPN